MNQPLLYYYSSPIFSRLKRSPFLGLLLIVVAFGILNLQCSWTPEVETVLYDSPVCVIALQTTHALKIPPTHPTSIPDILLRNIFGGITETHEAGMLQQLLFTTPLTTPVFSPSQIDFLALHLSKALSLATPEEIVHFRCPAREKEASEVQGYVAIFPPSNLLLTLKKNSFSPTHSKIENSRNPQSTTSLIFFHEEAFMKEKEIAPFMAIPPTFHGIVIDYQDFIPHHKNHSNQSSPHGTQIIHDPKKDVPPIRKESLNDQVRDLQRKVDQQAEEIRRLKQPVP